MRAMVLGAALALGAAGGAAAQAVDASDPDSVLQAVRAYGHKARLETLETGVPQVVARVEDINYAIHFIGCDGPDGCTQLQFAALFTMDPGLTAEFVNNWNEEWVSGRLSVDETGDPLFTYPVITQGGLNPDNFRAFMDSWTGALFGVIEDIGF